VAHPIPERSGCEPGRPQHLAKMSFESKKYCWPKWALPCLAGLALLAHGLCLGNGFTNWDDPALVTQNTRIQTLDLGTILRPVPGRSYQPVRELSHAVDLAIWGQRPLGHHAFNLLLHIGATLLLALLLARLLHDCGRADAIPIALLVAALFAVHPVNVEAVAWVSSRKYGLAAVGIFGACLCHLCGLRKSAVAAAILAMLSSPFGIVLPALIASLDFCRYGKAARAEWRSWLPIAISAILMYILMRSTLLAENSLARQDSVRVDLASMARSLFDSLQHLLFPVNLGVRYLTQAAESADWRVWAAIVGVVAVVAWAVKRGDRLVMTGLLWFAICWAPVSGVVPISTFMADRYLYLSAVGLFLAIAAVANSARWRGVFAVVLVLLTGMSMARTRVWKNSERLWRSEIARNSDHEIARYNLALALLEKGEAQEAEEHLRAAIDIRPSYLPPYLVLGQNLGGEAGLALLREAVRRAPDNALAAAALGESLIGAEAYEEACQHLERALKLDPELRDAMPLLARGYLRLGRIEYAKKMIDYALDLEPNSPHLHVGKGMILAEAGLPEEAVAHFQLSSTDPEAIIRLLRRNAKRAFATNPFAVVSALRTAILLAPNRADSHAELASAYFQTGRLAPAIESQQRAVDLAPKSAEHLANLGGMFAMEKRFDEALAALEQALALTPDHAKARANLQLLRRDMGQ
jgi:Tfp pilus assembly protein PilF